MSAAMSEKREMFKAVNNFNYDIQFTADISKQMQMPDRLAALDDARKLPGFSDPPLRTFGIDSAAYGMTMPDKIMLGETEYNLDHTQKVDDTEFGSEAGYDYDEVRSVPNGNSNISVTPQKSRNDADMFAASDMVVPATPGSMLRTTSLYASTSSAADLVGGDWMTIQRHVAKLTCRVERLEEENGRRRQRELLLYPLILGYCILQVARLLLTRSK